MKSRDKTVFLVVAFVAVIAIVGTVTLNRYEVRKEREQAKASESEKPIEPKEKTEEVQTTNTESVKAEIEKAETEVRIEPQDEKVELFFGDDQTIIWPVDGNVILNYSMDQTIYFPTLDQYKYNPALIISAEEGEPVLSAADGEVKEIKQDAKNGTMITVNLGNGYEAIYGQLGKLSVYEGEKLKAGDVIGYVEKPTKYYSVEGPNVYFQMLKDGKSVNPLSYMDE